MSGGFDIIWNNISNIGLKSLWNEFTSNYIYGGSFSFLAVYEYCRKLFIDKVDEFTINLFRKPTKKTPSKYQIIKKNGKKYVVLAEPQQMELRPDRQRKSLPEMIWNFTQTFFTTAVNNKWFVAIPQFQRFLVSKKRLAEQQDNYIDVHKDKKEVRGLMLSDYNKEYDIANMPELDLKLIKYTVLTPSSLNKDLKNNKNHINNNNLNIAKQERWLIKNTPISRNLTTANHSSLEAKKLIGSSLETPKHSSKNIWTSTFYSEGKKDIFKDYPLININNNQGYNFFEESREFYSKRFMYLVDHSNLNTTKTVNLSTVSNYNYINNYTNHYNVLLQAFKFQNNTKIDLRNLSKNINIYNDYILIGQNNEFLGTDSLVLFQTINNTNNTKQYVFFQNNLLLPNELI